MIYMKKLLLLFSMASIATTGMYAGENTVQFITLGKKHMSEARAAHRA